MLHRFIFSALAVLLCAGSLPATAAFPDKAIQIIVGFAPGDAIDGTARVIAEQLEKDLSVPVVVVNIAGGGGAKGAAAAAKKPADGYTLLMGSTGALTARPQISNSGYTTDDFVALAQLTEVPIGLAVSKDSPYQSLTELIDAAKAGTVKYATPAPGSTQHISMAAFAAANDLNLIHIGGKGGKGAVTKTLSGEVDFVFVGASNYTALAKSGDLKVLAVAAPERVAYLPDAPTFQEQGYDLNAAVWFGLLARQGTADDVLLILREAIDKVATMETTEALYRKFNFNSAYLNATDFQQRIEANVAHHADVLKAIGLIK